MGWFSTSKIGYILLKTVTYKIIDFFQTRRLTLWLNPTYTPLTEGLGRTVSAHCLMEIQERTALLIPAFLQREIGKRNVCRLSEPQNSPLFDIVKERKRSVDGACPGGS